MKILDRVVFVASKFGILEAMEQECLSALSESKFDYTDIKVRLECEYRPEAQMYRLVMAIVPQNNWSPILYNESHIAAERIKL